MISERWLSALAAFTLSTLALADAYPRTHQTHDFFAVHLNLSIVSPEKLANHLKARYEGQIGELTDHHKFSVMKSKTGPVDACLPAISGPLGHINCINGVLWSQILTPGVQLRHKRVPQPPVAHLNTTDWVEDVSAVQTRSRVSSALGITDPLFNSQWHLFNTVQLKQDMNVTGAWLEGVTGKGTVTAIIDDGLDFHSNDLNNNYFPAGSYNFVENSKEPDPKHVNQTHGTRCAGEIAAGKNGICGLGMAYDGKIAGIRLLSGQIDESDEAAAINYRYQSNDIYSCSWGPPDNGKVIGGPGTLVKRALENGVANGRRGKGSIFVVSAGNGGYLDDDCNFDGYANSIYTIAVGAIDREGNHPEYSEPCSALSVVAYASAGYQSEGADSIYTTDVGVQNCASGHGGTSAAAPLVAGAIALALSVRSELTWRDIQYLLYATAIPVNEEEDDWQMTKLGKPFSHNYGYGKVDSYGLVQMARNWKLVKPQTPYHSPWVRVNKNIPQGAKGLSSIFEVRPPAISVFERLEHVTVTTNVNHTRRGDLSIELHSPEGVVSRLSTTRRNDNETSGYAGWAFMSVAHWGESGIGNWTIVVKDTMINDFSGTFVSWQLSLWGEGTDSLSSSNSDKTGEGNNNETIMQTPDTENVGVSWDLLVAATGLQRLGGWASLSLSVSVVVCGAVGTYLLVCKLSGSHAAPIIVDL
ncbi:hypothetical protein H109_03623 [Trichophyton interdigitale MR816]|uniref:P/Homo B domain-containing protein n=1 Tax=Trichophyton interdigitale (strain MR816) TaxID=1215338 RepID=A0A059JA07_TRIIM|nr:hypothetical protein H101_00226 [Trichophyton interdigitale H6]KDB24528.1 hypothetical protein H109_03623 [Trichophyton interdigitale MR816]